MKTIRLGIFGAKRGSNNLKSILVNDGDIVALCDRDEAILEEAVKELPGNPTLYTDFDEFINHDMDAVYMCNCFHEHTPFAIRLLEKGIHVLCECTSNITMAEGVALVRAAEKSSAFFMLAENYPFMQFNQEMRKVFRGGTLGKALFAEGEYNHPMDFNDPKMHRRLLGYPEHWRNFIPATYYITHSLAPLMYITGSCPVRVSAMPVYAPKDEFKILGGMVGDRAAIITCLNDDDSVYRVVGCSAFGAHGNAYRICGTKGQMENLRGMDGKVMLRYNDWEIPEGMEEVNLYQPEWPEDERDLIEASGHGGGDFFVFREFFSCIRENRKPEFDEYFATTCASVAILAHRSLMEKGVPYDIPDFHKEEDRAKWENDNICPIPRPGIEANYPCCSHPDYRPTEEQYRNYLEILKD